MPQGALPQPALPPPPPDEQQRLQDTGAAQQALLDALARAVPPRPAPSSPEPEPRSALDDAPVSIRRRRSVASEPEGERRR